MAGSFNPPTHLLFLHHPGTQNKTEQLIHLFMVPRFRRERHSPSSADGFGTFSDPLFGAQRRFRPWRRASARGLFAQACGAVGSQEQPPQVVQQAGIGSDWKRSTADGVWGTFRCTRFWRTSALAGENQFHIFLKLVWLP